jgi:hypothetical protein
MYGVVSIFLCLYSFLPFVCTLAGILHICGLLLCTSQLTRGQYGAAVRHDCVKDVRHSFSLKISAA